MGKRATFIYFILFFFLRIVIGLNIAFRLFYSGLAGMIITTLLFSVSFFLHLTTKIYESWYKQIQAVLLELGLVILSVFSMIPEIVDVSEQTNNVFGIIVIGGFFAL